MYSLLVTIVCVLAAQSCASQSVLQVAVANNARILAVPRSFVVQRKAANPCTDGGMTCDNGMVSVCQNNQKVDMTCAQAFGSSMKYCNCEKNNCVAGTSPPFCPNDQAPTTDCSSPNTKFPEPSDCSKFSYCGANKKSTALQCASGFYFDVVTGKCVERAKTTCRIITCPSTGLLSFTAYPANSTYYVMCFAGKAEVKVCPNGYGMEKNICQFVCRKSGYFADNVDKAKYHVCSPYGSTWTKSTINCRKGEIYNAEEQMCIADAGSGSSSTDNPTSSTTGSASSSTDNPTSSTTGSASSSTTA